MDEVCPHSRGKMGKDLGFIVPSLQPWCIFISNHYFILLSLENSKQPPLVSVGAHILQFTWATVRFQSIRELSHIILSTAWNEPDWGREGEMKGLYDVPVVKAVIKGLLELSCQNCQ